MGSSADLPKVTRVGAYAWCVDGDRVLLTRVTDDGRWTLPGGGVEFGEHPLDGMVREVQEETGLVVAPDGVLGVGSVHLPGFSARDLPTADYHGVRIVWRARVIGGELRDEVAGTTDRAAWQRLDDVPGLPTVELVDEALTWWAAAARTRRDPGARR